jgi:hypothetical protein
MSVVVRNNAQFIRRGAVGRVTVQLVDCDGNAINASSVKLNVIRGDCVIYSEDLNQVYVAPRVHRIFKISGSVGQYAIDWGDQEFPATITGSAGVYPTGFVGGETLRLQLDDQIQTIAFQNTDQTLDQCINRVNATYGPIFGQLVAFNDSGQIQFRSKRLGRIGSTGVVNPGTSPSVSTAFGIPVNTSVTGTYREQETSCTDTLLFEWIATDALHPSEEIRVMQVVYVLPPVIFQILPQFRLMLDKSLKLVDPAAGNMLGYTDSMLLQYLIGGIQTINQAQPSIFFSLDNYPYRDFGSLLMEASLYWGLLSQVLYAVDTDVPNYSDQGASFVINHFQSLKGVLDSMSQALERKIPLMKLHFVNTGSVLTQMGPSFRLEALLVAAPNGSLFRNTFMGGN